MSNPAIRVTNLSKSYQLGATQERYHTLRDSIAGAGQAFRRRLAPGYEKPETTTLLALKDLTFEVAQGETLGIIGRNGAGKSTLLKVFSRITEPTSGKVELFGRVASLLEVGTGFHQELTGRENVYLNGAILGMSRREIERKFDDIVAFAEVEKFIDTPVKRFSSGMQLRLAFAVAAYLEPEILVIDEVLAVGDVPFQKRCIERMRDLTRSGATLLFVSHNMEMVPTLCRSVLWLRSGEIVEYGNSQRLVESYLSSLSNDSGDEDLSSRSRQGNRVAKFNRLILKDENDEVISCIRSGKSLRCLLVISSNKEIKSVTVGMVIKTITGTRIMSSLTDEFNYKYDLAVGTQCIECKFDNVPIRPGRQMIFELWLFDGTVLDHIDTARIVDVVEGNPSPFSLRADQGAIVCDYSWVNVEN